VEHLESQKAAIDQKLAEGAGRALSLLTTQQKRALTTIVYAGEDSGYSVFLVFFAKLVVYP
jgi:hypothetical protein